MGGGDEKEHSHFVRTHAKTKKMLLVANTKKKLSPNILFERHLLGLKYLSKSSSSNYRFFPPSMFTGHAMPVTVGFQYSTEELHALLGTPHPHLAPSGSASEEPLPKILELLQMERSKVSHDKSSTIRQHKVHSQQYWWKGFHVSYLLFPAISCIDLLRYGSACLLPQGRRETCQ